MTPTEMATLVEQAADMLDDETHRYVERYMPCPNGCTYDTAADRTTYVGSCAEPGAMTCAWGTVEDENAEHLNPFINSLRAVATQLKGTAQ